MWRSSIIAAMLLCACGGTFASDIPSSQFGSVAISADSIVVDQQSSTALASLELQVGHTFNEAELRIHPLPDVAPWKGFDGMIYVSAISLPGEGEHYSQVDFQYDFRLTTPAEYTLRHTKQGDSGTTFSIASGGGELISLTDNVPLPLHGRFEPGNYTLAIEAAAFSSFAANRGVQQDYSQLDFALLLVPVPEPTALHLVLAATGLLFLGCRTPTR